MRRIAFIGQTMAICLLALSSLTAVNAQPAETASFEPTRIDSSTIEVTKAGQPQVLLHTSMGDILLELYADRAPNTVRNFIQYAEDDYYAGTIFHRVIEGFMIQGGGFTEDMTRKETRNPVTNEADNNLTNERGTIAMARTGDPHSATSQFFINHSDNRALDHRNKNSSQGWGYTVFGKVVKGMEVVDAIAATDTGPIPPFNRDVPLETIHIESVEVFQAAQ